jgi:hypothetical protein
MQNKQPTLAVYSILIAIATGLVFNFLFLWQRPGLSAPIFYLWIVGIILGGKYLRDGALKWSNISYLYLVLFLVSLVPLISQNGTLTFFSLGTIVIGLTYTFLLDMWGLGLRRFNYAEMGLLIAFQQLAQIGYFFKPIIDLRYVDFHGLRNNPNARLVLKIAVGLIIAMPLVLLMVVLFANADQAFGKIFASNMKFDLFGAGRISEIIVWFIIACLPLGYSSVLFYYQFKTDSTISTTKRIIDPVISVIVAVALNLVFLCFVIVQFVYLFADKENIAKLGFTYAEYARQGFWQLIVIAGISLLVVYLLRKFGYFRNAANNVLLQFSLLLQVGLTLVVLYSAYFRLNIYEEAYSYTQTRLFVYAFMLFLALTFVYLALGVVVSNLLNYFSLYTFVLGCAILVGLALLNPDAFIARSNIERYVTGKSPSTGLDSKYLIYQLSSDAYMQLLDVDIYQNDENILCQVANSWIKETKSRVSLQTFNLAHASNISKAQAKLAMYIDDKGDLVDSCYRFINYRSYD